MAAAVKKPLVVYGVIALAVMLPLLLPGHILTLDMALTPDLPLPEVTSSSFLFRLLLYVLNIFLPTHVLEKALFLSILVLSSLGMHHLVARTLTNKARDVSSDWAIYIASTLYAINPFTYSRFMAGQYSVLLGYALLPFFASALLDFLYRPDRKRCVPVALWTLAISVVSIHSTGLLVVFTAVALLDSMWRYRKDAEHLRRILRLGAGTVIFVIVASSYWLVPFLAGDSPAGEAVQNFTVGDQQAYRTTGDGAIGRFANVIRLQGFWAEGKNLYLLPQEHIPAWGFVTIFVWVVIGAGFKSLFKSDRQHEALIFLGAGAVAILLAIFGVSEWATRVLPELGGFREPHKFIGLLAMAFALFAAHGIPKVVRWFDAKAGDTAATISLCVVLMLPVLWTPTMFWGFAGQLRPRTYPIDWHVANEKLNQDTDDFKVLFLPWHLYMHFRFAGRIIVNPAENFFDKPVIVSNDPELHGSSRADQDPLKAKLSDDILPHAAEDTVFAHRLAEENIKYILLAKETDASDYAYLSTLHNLESVYAGDTVTLYRNELWEKYHAQ